MITNLAARPSLEGLEGRRLLSLSSAVVVAPLPGDVNGDGRVNLNDEQILVRSFGSKFGQPKYNFAADLNHNGFIGQGDARIILRHLTPPTPRIPLRLTVHLTPGDQLRTSLSPNSGGETRKRDVTIVGRTTPGAFIFSDPAAADFSFSGPAFAADANGLFSYKVHLTDRLTNFEFLAVDSFGHQTIRSLPIRLKLE
jgi:hypothetical protein